MMSCGKKEKKGGSSVRFGGSPNRDLASRHDKHANRKRLLPRVTTTHFERPSRNPAQFTRLKLP